MGCGTSKIETESAVKHCRARKKNMKQAVAYRHAFAAAHASYANSLKSTGAAIWQMAEVEAIPKGAPQPAPASIAVRNTVTNLFPPPQPPDDAFPGPRTPLSRAASMPAIPTKNPPDSSRKNLFHEVLSEENEELFADQEVSSHKPTHSVTLYDPFDGPGTSTFDTEYFEPKLPEAEDDEVEEDTLDDHYRTQIPTRQGRRSEGDSITLGSETRQQLQVPPPQQRVGKADLSFGAVIRTLDDLFLKSYEAAGEVSRLLEVKRDFHHVPSVDEKHGIEDHFMKVSKILTWNHSSPGRNLADDDAIGAHNLASTLDRLHAWEKKLHDEVKIAEATRLELTRRSTQLKNLRERREASSTFAKTKALVKSLNTRYLVEIEAMDAAYIEVKRLRDDILYPQLMSLLEALKKMWKVMHDCHHSQVPLVDELSNLPTPSTQATSEICIKFTEDLEREVTLWHSSLNDMVMFQKKSVMSLQEWVLLNAKQIDNEAVDYLPVSQEDISLCDLCRTWEDVVEKLSAEPVLRHLMEFSSILQDVASKQADEIKQKKRKEDLLRDLEKKEAAFKAFESKYKEKVASKGAAAEGSLESGRHPLQERLALVELLKKNAAEEEQRHARLCEENSTMIFESLKAGLPSVVYSIAEFSHSCAKEYGQLYDRLRAKKMAS